LKFCKSQINCITFSFPPIKLYHELPLTTFFLPCVTIVTMLARSVDYEYHLVMGLSIHLLGR
jgi:hypothetical protein